MLSIEQHPRRDIDQTSRPVQAQTLPSLSPAKWSPYDASDWKVILVDDFVCLFWIYVSLTHDA